jgi:uncharacterized protein YkwD
MKRRYKVALPFITLLVALFAVGGYVYANKPKPVEKPIEKPRVEVKPITLDTNKVFILVNAERTKAGLNPLVRDVRLDKSSAEKCQDMVAKDYFSHTSPDGIAFKNLIRSHTSQYYVAGENLAKGYYTEERLVAGWMASPTHRDNMLTPRFDVVGYSFCLDGYQNYTVQHLLDYK